MDKSFEGVVVGEKLCPLCGCKGKKKKHIRVMDEDHAKSGQWRDIQCGSCGGTFRGYEWPPKRE